MRRTADVFLIPVNALLTPASERTSHDVSQAPRPEFATMGQGDEGKMLPSSPTMAEEGGEEIPLLQLARYERRFAVFASVRPAIEKSGGLRPPNRGVAVGSGDPWHRENNVSAATSGISHAQLRASTLDRLVASADRSAPGEILFDFLDVLGFRLPCSLSRALTRRTVDRVEKSIMMHGQTLASKYVR